MSAQGDEVVVNWHADYKLFGNPVHNDVMATLVIQNGKIVQHTDVYSWDKWLAQVIPGLGSAVSWPGVSDGLRDAFGAILHGESDVANAKLAAAAVERDAAKDVQAVEHGITEKLTGLGR